MRTIKLQGIYTECPAKSVKELQIDDVIKWNYGYTSTVVSLSPTKSGKSIKVGLKSNSDGVIRNRTMSAETLVAIAN